MFVEVYGCKCSLYLSVVLHCAVWLQMQSIAAILFSSFSVAAIAAIDCRRYVPTFGLLFKIEKQLEKSIFCFNFAHFQISIQLLNFVDRRANLKSLHFANCFLNLKVFLKK